MTQSRTCLLYTSVAIERDSISRIERGTRIVTDYELKIFSKALGVSMEWLTDESGTL